MKSDGVSTVIYKKLNYLPAILKACGTDHAIICPGSRSAPLMLSFVRCRDIQCITLPDERSAAFHAMGMALQTGKPVVVICTSGTAVLNIYPAVAEAFYQEIPLIVLTADRPPEMIDQKDGQTIRQENIFEKHILKSFNAPASLEQDDDFIYFRSIVEEAANAASGQRKGPVHINFPFREPFYPGADEVFEYPEIQIKQQEEEQGLYTLTENDRHIFDSASNILFVLGQQAYVEGLGNIIDSFNCPVIVDATSNIYSENRIRYYDTLMRNNRFPAPDLLVTFGGPVVSKILKNYIRSHKPSKHIHISPWNDPADPFQSVTHRISADPSAALSGFLKIYKRGELYKNELQVLDDKVAAAIDQLYDEADFSELKVCKYIFDHLPEETDIHLANSMPVRWANIFGVKKRQHIYSNRGTSGIDGCTSTAVGAASLSANPSILITGDMAFFYDINGLWNPRLPSNFRIIILNNGGGGIFSLIDGPSALPERDEWFVNSHRRNAKLLAEHFGLKYIQVQDMHTLEAGLDQLINMQGPAVLEIFTNAETNGLMFEQYRAIRIQ